MPTVKKLTFAPLFIIIFILLIYQLNPLFGSYDFIFSLSLATLIQLITISALVVLSSFLFTLTATIANSWKLVAPLGLIASLLSFLFLSPSLGIVFSIATLISLALSFSSLENKLKTYLNFDPASLFGPIIRNLTSCLVLAICLTYFLSISKTTSDTSFQIPDSLIETALKISQTPSQLSIPQEQLDLLKENPDLLRQSGLDPNILDNLGSSATELIKQTVKDQIQTLIKPYQGIIPAILSVFLFLTLQSLTSIISLLIHPLLWLTFYILEKSGYIKFTQEMRPIKKMVV